jgi:hypothetical protein
MLCALRTNAIQIKATFPFATSGRVITSPARVFDFISGKCLPIRLFAVFLE